MPEGGQVVEVRGSTWAVAEVRQQGLPRSPADEGTDSGLQHAVTLQALDEDRLGEELTVIWELEVGHTVSPAQGLPEKINQDGFDDPNMLAGFVDAMRWGAVTSADEHQIQAPFHSGVTVEAYQLEPLRRALSSPRTNLLLADDVGLGKTIEAGLVVQELLLRHRARTAIIVCPPSLSIKWQDEMRDKFGLDFTIINSEMMREVRRRYGLHANPFVLFPRVIVSMAWLPAVRAQRMLRDRFTRPIDTRNARRYAFDILLVDEAHHVAPASPSAVGAGRGYSVDTQRTLAVRELAEHCEHRLFLSATPHNGHPESFMALMEMVDSRRFLRGGKLDQGALREVTVRRLKSDLRGQGLPPPRVVRAIPVSPEQREQEMFARLDHILADSARANNRGESGDITAMLFKKRLLSSPYAFGTTLRNYLDARAGRAAAASDWDYDDILGDGASDEEEGLWTQEESTRIRQSKSSDPLVAAGPGELEMLVEWGLSHASRPDSRLKELVRMLNAICRPDGNWDHATNERVVVFTEYADTLQWIETVLLQEGYGGRLAVIQGSTPPEDREVIRERFTKEPKANDPNDLRVLLATDAAGEGIDLQNHCHHLVNVDIPFNPSRLEQRIGRIDRYGQTETPLVYHFAAEKGSSAYGADMHFMGYIARKVATVQRDLGSVNPVIADEIQRHFTGGRRGSRRRPPQAETNEVINKALAGGLDLNARLTQLANGYADSQEELHIRPANLRRVVDTALRITHEPPLIRIGDDRTDADVFGVPGLGPQWQHALEGLDTRTEQGVQRPVTFDDQAAKGRQDLVYVHLGHRLVRKAQRLLRRSLWSVDAQLNRVTALVVPDVDESFVAAVTRMVLVGRGGLRLHEEIFLAGVRLRGRRPMAEERAEKQLDKALDGMDLTLAPADIRTVLTSMWNEPGSPIRARLEETIERRADGRHERVRDQLGKRQAADKSRAEGIYANFRRTLEDSLKEATAPAAYEQMALWPTDEQRQRQRDIEAMRQRLDQLAGEEQRELEAIDERYRDVRHHTTAAAVVFALTPDDATNPASLRGGR